MMGRTGELAYVALTLANPSALLVLGLAAPILLFHFYARRRRRLIVPYVGLLREAMGPTRETARFKRLRDRASLILQLLGLGLLALALAGLAPAQAREVVRPLVIVIDADRTTAVEEADGRTRLAHALDLADALIAAHPSGPMSVLAAGEAPRVLVPQTEDREAARRELAATRLHLAPARLRVDPGAAVALALATLAVEPEDIVLVSARARTEALPAGVRVLGVGAMGRDGGLQDLALTEAPDGSGFQLRIDATFEGAVPADAHVEVALSGEAPRRVELEIGEDGHARARLQVPAARQARTAEIELVPADAYVRNDRLAVAIPAIRRPRVLVVHDGRGIRPYTLAVLRGMGAQLDAELSGAVAVADLAAAPEADVFVADGVALPEGTLRSGAWLFLGPLSGTLPFELGAVLERPRVWRTRTGHPLMQDLRFVDAEVARGRVLTGPGLLPLAWVAGEAVIAEGEREGVRYVAVGLDPEASDVVLRAAWPLLLERAILRLTRGPSRLLPPVVRTGEVLRPGTPIPGGPRVEFRVGERVWSGAVRVEGESARVPAGLRGLMTIRGTQADPDQTTSVGIVEPGPKDRIAPVRAAAPRPAAARPAIDRTTRWRILLVVGGLLLLFVDLLAMRKASRT